MKKSCKINHCCSPGDYRVNNSGPVRKPRSSVASGYHKVMMYPSTPGITGDYSFPGSGRP